MNSLIEKVRGLKQELEQEMCFTGCYRKAKDNVQKAFNCSPREARLWLETHCGVKHSGRGFNSRITCDDKENLERLEKLAGPHGATLAKIIEART